MFDGLASTNYPQCYLYSTSHRPLKVGPRLCPYHTLYTSCYHILVLARDSRKSLLVGAPDMQRNNNDFPRRLGMPVARTATDQLW